MPGVGSYELRKDKTFIVPSFRFDSEKRENLEVNKTTKDFPGPGKYKDIDTLESKGFKWTFPQQGMYKKIKNRNTKIVRISIPGPGEEDFILYLVLSNFGIVYLGISDT